MPTPQFYSGNSLYYKFPGAPESNGFMTRALKSLVLGPGFTSPFLGDNEDVVDFQLRRQRAQAF